HINHVARHNAGIQIMGSGGARSAMTALQLIYAGAGIVQVCSAVQRYSYEIVHEMIQGLQFVLYCRSRPDLRLHLLEGYGEESLLPAVEDNKGVTPVESVMDITGELCAFVGERGELEGVEKWRVHAQINPDSCISCGLCATSCRDNGPAAIGLDKATGKFVIDADTCVGCAMCSMCPTGAITYKQIPGLDDLTEEQRANITLGF
ncbi:hypothetical protein KIPB_009989, partial [Kipferlia bialata]